jgi:hypothetical protein
LIVPISSSGHGIRQRWYRCSIWTTLFARHAAEEARGAAEQARAAAEEARHAIVDAMHATADTLTANLEQMKIIEEMRRTYRDLKDKKDQADWLATYCPHSRRLYMKDYTQ